MNIDLMTAKSENPASYRYVFGNGNKEFSAYIDKIGLSLRCAKKMS